MRKKKATLHRVEIYTEYFAKKKKKQKTYMMLK